MSLDREFRSVVLLGACIGLGCLAPAPRAQRAEDAAVPASRSPRVPVDPDSRVARRLLQATGGGVIRAESRRVGDHWEVRRDQAWQALPAGMVAQARLERDVLKQAAPQLAAARRGDAPEQVAAAQWLLAEGLMTEAFGALDDVLAEQPDQPDALALLRAGVPSVALPTLDVPAEALPDAHARLLDFAGAAPPALRELALNRLLATPDPDGLRVQCRARLGNRSAGVRAAAMLALHRLPVAAVPDQDELSTLLRRAVIDNSDEVRRAASLALGDVGEEGLIVPIVAALDSRHPVVAMNAAQALGAMGYRAAVEPLIGSLAALSPGDGAPRPSGTIHVGRQIAFVQDFDVDVAQNAAIGNPSIGTLQEGATLDARIMGASGPSMGTRSAVIRHSLEQLTGANPGRTRAAWASWWAANRESWNGAPIGDKSRYAPR